jgi:hypothetical protein
MNYSHKYKFVWHCPPKVASRSTADVFRTHCDLNPHIKSPIPPSNWPVFSHENMWPDVCPKDYLHIVSVRHPYYRWISYWKHDQWDGTELPKGTTDPLDGLKKFPIERCDALSEWRVITQFESRIDYIIHAENWLSDIKNLPFISDDMEIKNPNRGRLLIPNGVTWDEDELRELVYQRFRQDYDNLGYGKWDNFDHLWDSKPNTTPPVVPTSNTFSNIFPKKSK